MIVTCEACETQFQLDEARVPDAGARVRCSRCKHAFVVHRPAASPDEAIHRAADRALEEGRTPDVTADLPDPNEQSGADWEFNEAPDDQALATAAPVEAAVADAGDGDDSDFGVLGPDDSLSLAGEDDGSEPPAGPDAGSLSLADEAADASDAAPAEESPFGASFEAPPESAGAETGDALGEPGEWDLFDDLEGGGSAAAPAVASADVAPNPVSVERRQQRDARVEAASGRTGPRIPIGLVARAGGLAGWLATGALCAVGVVHGLGFGEAATASFPLAAAGPNVEDLRGRWVENAHLGRIFVVSGRLHHAGAEPVGMPPLQLVVRDGAGRALGPALPLAAPRPARVLREGRASAFQSDGAAFRTALAPNESRPFEGVVWPLPATAAGFEIRAGR